MPFNLGCNAGLFAPAAADTGNLGCDIALIAPAAADNGNSGCEISLIAPATARCDRVGCGRYIPAPSRRFPVIKSREQLPPLILMVRGQKDQFCTHSRFNSTLWVQAGGYCPRISYAASIVLFG